MLPAKCISLMQNFANVSKEESLVGSSVEIQMDEAIIPGQIVPISLHRAN